jgi:hypothetical protein
LLPGDAADDADVWCRSVTNTSHVKKGKVHHAEFKKWLSPPEDRWSTWKLELSGRLLSLVGSIAADANRRLELQKQRLEASGKPFPACFQYVGTLHAVVSKVRVCSTIDCDVLWRPNEDEAHANIVVYDKDENEILTVSDFLLDLLTWTPAADVPKQPALRAKA